MEEQLEQLLNDVKQRVEVLDGENPVMRIQDAIRIAERAGILYRWAQNGDVYEVRQSPNHDVVYVREGRLCQFLCTEIVRLRQPQVTHESAPELVLKGGDVPGDVEPKLAAVKKPRKSK